MPKLPGTQRATTIIGGQSMAQRYAAKPATREAGAALITDRPPFFAGDSLVRLGRLAAPELPPTLRLTTGQNTGSP